MSPVSIFWDPRGFELDSLGKKKLRGVTDGDTPIVSVSIRMLSIDTPEKKYYGDLSKYDAQLAQLAAWMNAGSAPINSDLAAYLHPKLATGKAGSLQKKQGEAATKMFQYLLDKRLIKPNGKKRDLFLKAADEHFDHYGRLLAYLAPYYTKKELASLPPKKRATFNLLMVESGWAATFPIYPSVPKHMDLVLLQKEAQKALTGKKGAWADSKMLTGYEFRMCVRLYNVAKKLVAGKSLSSKERYGWIERFCVDMTTREVFYPQSYYKVKSFNRIFIWPEDVQEAVGRMNLLPPK